MWTLAFYLTLAAFFLPKKLKTIKTFICCVAIAFLVVTASVLVYLDLPSTVHGVRAWIGKTVFFASEANPFNWLYIKLSDLLAPLAKTVGAADLIYYRKEFFIPADILVPLIQIIIAFIAMRLYIFFAEENGKKKLKLQFEKCPKTEKKEKIKMENDTSNTQSAGTAEYNKPISMWGYFGYEILFALPIIGWIILIVHAIGAKNVNVRNFARSYFCLLIILAVIFVLNMGSLINSFGGFGW